MNGRIVLYLADAVADDRGVLAAPGAVLLRWLDASPAAELLAVGVPDAVLSHAAATTAPRVDLTGHVLTPALVNAHVHLDLTSIGPRPFDPDAEFADWLADIRRSRPADDASIRTSVREGIARSLRGGCVAVGDIAGAWSTIPIEEVRRSPLIGVSYLECFGLGAAIESMARMDRVVAEVAVLDRGVRLGIQPHAPFSAGQRLYEHAASLSATHAARLATHLAESMSEREILLHRRGPIREFLESIHLWNDETAGEFGRATSSVSHLSDVLRQGQWLLAHVNDCADADLEILRATGAMVAYCPRASSYFHHDREFGSHRYREMMRAGVPVALGVDSVVCLPPEQSDRLSVLDDMRLLWRRDGAEPADLLAMATVNGATALGLTRDQFRFSIGSMAGVIAIPIERNSANDPLIGALEGVKPPKLLTDESGSRLTANATT